MKLVFALACFAIGFIALGLLATNTLNTVNTRAPIFTEVVQKKDVLADVLPPAEYILEPYAVALQAVSETDSAKVKDDYIHFEQLKTEYLARHDHWAKTLPDGSLKTALVDDSYSSAVEFFDIAEKRVFAAALAGDTSGAQAIASGPLRTVYQRHRSSIDQVVALSTQGTASAEKSANYGVVLDYVYLIAIGVVGILGVIVALGAFEDIVNRKRHEEALHRLNRELRAISDCNQVLMRAEDEQDLLDEVCRIVCDEAGYRMAWVGYAEHDDAKTVRPVAWAGAEDGFLASASITWADVGRGPTGTAIRTGSTDTIQDFAAEPEAAPWREAALQRGYRSGIAVSLKDEHSATFGALTIYSSETGALSAEETRLLEELAGDLAFGITGLRTRAERERAEEALVEELRASEQLFRALVENSPDFIARYDREYRRIYVNPAIQRLFAVPPEDLIGTTPTDQSPLFAPQAYIDRIKQVIETGTECDLETPARTEQGDMHWNHIRFVPEFGPDGDVATVMAIGRDIHEIKESERRFETLAENFPDLVVRFDPEGRLTYANPTVTEVFGVSVEDSIGKTLSELALSAEQEQKQALAGSVAAAFAEGVTGELEVHLTTPAGERTFEARHVPEFDATGNMASVLSVFHDVTERKEAEKSLLRLNRELRAISDCNQVLIRATDEQALLDEVCRLICDEAGYRMAWVGYVEHDRAKSVRPVAWAGVEDGYLASADITWADTKRGRDPAGTAARTGQCASIEDYSTDPLAEPWREATLQRGYRSGIAMPLKDENADTFGVLCIFSSEPGAVVPEEARLLQELADDLAFGITTLRARSTHRQAEQALRTSEQRYRDVFNNSTDVLYLLEVTEDGHFRNLEVNPAFEASTGLSREQVLGKVQEEVVSEDVAEIVNAKYRRCVEAGEPLVEEVELQLPSGRHYYDSTLIPLRDDTGRIDRILGVSHDITDTREAEKAKRDAARYSRSLIEASLDPLVTISPAGTITDVNRAAEQTIGLLRTQLIGTNFAGYVTEPARVKAGFGRVLEQGAIRDFPLTLLTASGDTVDVLYNATTYVNEAGELQGVLATAREVTQLENARLQARNALLELIEAIALTVEKRDPYTAGHQKRVAELASAMAAEMGLDDATIEGIRMGASIHDLGKIYIPAEILARPGGLSSTDRQIIHAHPTVGAEIVHGVHSPWPIEQMILQHHERLDGSGYPQGLKGDDVSQEARIIAVADVVEAMSSHRPYRPALGIDTALEEVASGQGTRFDHNAVEACVALFREHGFEFRS